MMERVLIVDDSAAMRHFLRASIERLGLAREIREASSGFEAMRVLPREPLDLLLVDVNMPDIHGLEVIRWVRASTAHAQLPVIVISSEASSKDRARGLTVGADAWLDKPFTDEQLDATVRAVIEKRRGAKAP